MILGQSLERLISKLNAGGDGDGGGGGGSDRGDPEAGNRAAAEGIGRAGQIGGGGVAGTSSAQGVGGRSDGGGESSASKTVSKTVDKVTSFFAGEDKSLGKTPGQIAGDLAASFGFGNIGAIATEADRGYAGSIRNTQDRLSMAVKEARFSETDEERAFTEQVAKDIASELGFKDLAEFNTAMTTTGIPRGLDIGIGMFSPMNLSQLATTAGVLDAVTGLPSGMRAPDRTEATDVTDGIAKGGRMADVENVLQSLRGGGDVADNTTDLLAQLRSELGMDEGEGDISFKVGNQTVSFMPRAKRDELALLLDYLRLQQGESQFARELAQNEPSFVDKSSQLLGLGSDALGLWSGISDFF